jgi:PEGA domain-containing protein
MKTNKFNNIQFCKNFPFLLIFTFIIVLGCNSDSDSTPQKLIIHKLLIATNEIGSAIYLNGVYTGKVTPSEIAVEVGEHMIGIGLKNSRNYLRKTVTVDSSTESLNVTLNNTNLQQPKIWKALFIGVNKVSVNMGSCVSEYSTAELDLAYDFFNWSFKKKVENYSYNTIKWKIDRRDIDSDTVILNNENLITPAIIDSYITDINKGDYDLIVTFFRGSQQNCFVADFIGIAWYNVTELNSDASYYTIRYYDAIENAIKNAKNNDPGMFIHEWLHTTAEIFYPNRGEIVPKENNQVVHAAVKYGYSFPWMTWYEGIISGQIKEGNTYTGIGPDAFLACSVRESALENCP